MSNTGPLPPTGGDNRNLGPILVRICYKFWSKVLGGDLPVGRGSLRAAVIQFPLRVFGPTAVFLYGLT